MGLLDNANPQKAGVFLINTVDPSQTIRAQYNPTEFTEALAVNYARLAPRGLSHEVLQYSNTGNLGFSFELFFNANDADTGGVANTAAQVSKNLETRKLLHSWCYPRRTARGLSGVGPPRILFVWPSVVTLTTVITSLEINHTRFAKNMKPIEFRAVVALEEIRDFKILSDEVLSLGTMRGPDREGR